MDTAEGDEEAHARKLAKSLQGGTDDWVCVALMRCTTRCSAKLPPPLGQRVQLQRALHALQRVLARAALYTR